MTPLCQRLFDNQKIIAAGVCLYKRNHGSLILPQRSENNESRYGVFGDAPNLSER
jgi:hypothetical protein